MKKIFTALVILLATFSTIKACDIYVEFDPAWSCNDALTICYNESGMACITVVESEVITLPEDVELTFITGDCSENTFFNIFNTNDELLMEVSVTAPNLEWTWTINCGALPVELISFNGRATKFEVKLNWLLGSQENLERIIIRRDEQTVGVLENTDRERLAWSFTDKTAAVGTNYYDLEFRDYDGTVMYSDVIAVEVTNKVIIEHVTKDIRRTHTFKSFGDPFVYQVQVFTLNGQLILERNWSGEGQDELDILFGNPGIYIVAMNDSTYMQTFKVVVN
tara:strand:+ start:4843 stop:5679 length:837 start_codon:yes stop_codon:yes gene_type:complete